MPDNYWLYGPDGASVLNLGSWLQAEPGPDFDTGDVMQNILAENAAVDGARNVSERGRMRRFTLPLLVASGPAGSLDKVLGMIRRNARPGGYIDLQPQGTPTGEMIRFDLAGGEMAERYHVQIQAQTARRIVDLALDVQPFGYMPTWITVGSIASMGLPGRLTFASPPVLGDVAGFGELTIQPRPHDGFAGPTSYALGSWGYDFLAWSLNATGLGYHAVASHTGMPYTIGLGTAAATALPSSAHPPLGATGQALGFHVNGGIAGEWRLLFTIFGQVQTMPGGSKHRVWAYARSTPSAGIPVYMRADAAHGQLFEQVPLATGTPVASLPNQSPSGALVFQASPAYQLVDLGIVTLPSSPSMAQPQYPPHIRISARVASNVPSMQVHCAGVFFQRVDAPNGVMQTGLTVQNVNGRSRLQLNSRYRRLLQMGGVATDQDIAQDGFVQPQGQPQAYYRGDFPMLAPSTTGLDLLMGARRHAAAGATSLPAHTAPFHAAVGVRYQPRFVFMKGI